MHASSRRSRGGSGFTLIEILLVIAIIGLLTTIAAISQRGAHLKARDVKRVSDMKELEKAMTYYLSENNAFPAYTGCIDESADDVVTSELRAKGIIPDSAGLKDAVNPSDVSKCYYYDGTASQYTIRYTLETNSSAGTAGDHLIQP